MHAKICCVFTRQRFCRQNYSLRSDSLIMAGGETMQTQSGRMQRVHEQGKKVRMARAISFCPFLYTAELTLSWEERGTAASTRANK